MSEQLIRTSELCKRLSMGKHTAITIMAEYGIFPICFGAGRGRGTFWLSSAVDSALRQMHENAQKKIIEAQESKNQKSTLGLADMSIDDLYALTQGDVASTQSSGTFGHVH